MAIRNNLDARMGMGMTPIQWELIPINDYNVTLTFQRLVLSLYT